MLVEADHTTAPAPERCLQLYRKLAAGVTILSAQAGTGPVGLTASSVTSLSLKPPLLMANLAIGSYTLAAIEQRRSFGVHLLHEDQQQVAADFASPTGPRFSGHEHRHVLGVPILSEALAWSVCFLTDSRRYGDHVLIVGEIVAVGTGEGRPLLWHDRQFGHLHDSRRLTSPVGIHDELWNGT